MGILELLASAETSSDLQHHERQCHVDVLGAAGMAASKEGHLSLYRLKFLSDPGSMDEAKGQFLIWTKKVIIRRQFKLSAKELAPEILILWLDDLCKTCQGRGIVGNRGCSACASSGKEVIKGEKNRAVVITDVLEKADRTIEYIKTEITRRLK